MKIFKKKAEMYIDTAVTILISFFILYVSVSLFSYFNQYQDMKNISNDLLKYCADKGYTSTADVEDKYNDLLQTYGFSKDEDKENVKISFSGTEYFDGSKVQLDDKIQLTIQSQYKIKLLSSNGINISTMSVTNSKNSNKYWKTEDIVSLTNNFHEGIISEGGTYISTTDGELTEGMQFPSNVNEGDKYLYGDYTYTYLTASSGWKVSITNYEDNYLRESFGEILTRINKKYVTDMSNTFSYCDSLKIAPKIPSTVTNMYGTFYNCYQLKSMSNIPSGVIGLSDTFYNCHTLTSTKPIPSTIKSMQRTFYGCSSLTTAPNMTNATAIESMQYTFYNCTKLKSMPDLTNCTNLKYSQHTYYGCSSLTTVTTLPSGMIYIDEMFRGCTSLTDVSNLVIPSSVQQMNYTFAYCTNLTGSVKVNCNLSSSYIKGCLYKTQITEILGSCSATTKTALLKTVTTQT